MSADSTQNVVVDDEAAHPVAALSLEDRIVQLERIAERLERRAAVVSDVGGQLPEEAGAVVTVPPVRVIGLWHLFRSLLDELGLTVHQQDLSSRTYRLLRHSLYSGLMSLFMFLAILVDCYFWDRYRSCMVLLQTYAMSIGFMVVYWQTRYLMKLACSFHRCPCGAPGGGRLALAYAVVYHACAVSISSAGLLGLVLVIFELGLQESKTFIVIVVVGGALASIRCAKVLAVRLIHLEHSARRTERRAFQERLAPDFAVLQFLAGTAHSQIDFAGVRRSHAEARAQREFARLEVLPFDEGPVFEAHPDCCICSRAFDNSVEIRRTDCGHVFHSDCLLAWLERSLTCPLCRDDLTKRQGGLPSDGLVQVVGAQTDNVV